MAGKLYRTVQYAIYLNQAGKLDKVFVMSEGMKKALLDSGFKGEIEVYPLQGGYQ